MNCKPEIILEGEDFNISRCAGCHRIGLYYKNLLVGFDQQEFWAFCRSFLAIDFDASSIIFPDDQRHILTNTCHPDIQFTFNLAGFKEFSSMLQQSMIMLEARSILQQNAE